MHDQEKRYIPEEVAIQEIEVMVHNYAILQKQIATIKENLQHALDTYAPKPSAKYPTILAAHEAYRQEIISAMYQELKEPKEKMTTIRESIHQKTKEFLKERKVTKDISEKVAPILERDKFPLSDIPKVLKSIDQGLPIYVPNMISMRHNFDRLSYQTISFLASYKLNTVADIIRMANSGGIDDIITHSGSNRICDELAFLL
ncbi:MAG: hypothetical protein NTX91_01215 [candidate division SR1 bacterium]|nr:hypothetical protein [candidate division SR1 bacterium]